MKYLCLNKCVLFCGFKKGLSTQQCLLPLLGKWKNAVDTGKMFGALLTNLSKAFDCLNHDLLIAKLNAYGFTLLALELIYNYLSNRKQRVQVNDSHSLVYRRAQFWKLFYLRYFQQI